MCCALALGCAVGGCQTAKPPAPHEDIVLRARNDLARSVALSPRGEQPEDAAWLQVQQDDLFRRIRRAGFTAVVLPINFAKVSREEESTDTRISQACLQRIGRLVKLAQRMGLAVVLSGTMRGDPAAPADRQHYVEDWRQVADYLAGAPASLYFGFLDPSDGRLSPAEWSDLAEAIRHAIRTAQPDRILIVGAPQRGSPAALGKLRIAPDTRCIHAFVYDEPKSFTLQGEPELPGADAWLGTKWSGNIEERARLEADLDHAARWARDNGRILFCASFGSTDKADPQSRLNWTAAVARALEAHGIPWCYAAFDGDMGIYDDLWNVWRQPLTGALLNQ